MTDQPRFAVHTASIPQVPDVAEAIRVVARSGATGVGLFQGQFTAGREAEYREVIAECGLTPTCFVPEMWTIYPPAFAGADQRQDPKERVDRICDDVAKLADFRPEIIVVGPGTSGDPGRPIGRVEEVILGVRQIADVAAEHGLQVGFELLAERRGSPLYTVPQMMSAIEAVDRENVGIMFDFFHSWCEPDIHDRLRRHAPSINSVQINDIKVVERSGADRELPGLGRNVAPALIAALLEGGYDGWWELEVLSDDGRLGVELPDSYWRHPAAELLARARSQFQRCWAEAQRLLQKGPGR